MSSVERARREREQFLQEQVDRFAEGVDKISQDLTVAIRKIWEHDPDWVRANHPSLVEQTWEEVIPVPKEDPADG